jgi:purine-binding chemotaxis protein CheW
MTYVRLEVGGERYALPVEHVREVGSLGDVTPLPRSGPYTLGVVNVRGNIVAVFDLGSLLGVARAGSAANVVVAELDEGLVGFAVDEVTGVGELADVLPEVGGLLIGTANVAGRLVGILDLTALVEHASARQAA